MRLPSAHARTLALLCVWLSGCTGLFDSTAKPEQTYYLRAPSATAAAANGTGNAADAVPAATGASVRVARPFAGPGLDTPRLLLVQADRRMNFYTESRWPAPIPEVVEALAVQTLRASGAWTSVQDSNSPFPADYLLQITVRRFEADYTAGGPAPEVHVVLDVSFGRREGRETAATFTAAGAAPAATNRLGAVVAAFEQAAGAALEVLSQQAQQAARADAQRAADKAARPPPAISR